MLAALLGGCGESTLRPYDGGGRIPAEPGRTLRFGFDEAVATLEGPFFNVFGDWRIREAADAPSAPRVLLQAGQYQTQDYPRLVLRDLQFGDLAARVRCRIDEGRVDATCGLMFRYRDEENYLLAAANAAEQYLRLYEVAGSDRLPVAQLNAFPIERGRWHELGVRAEGATITLLWDGQERLQARDPLFERGALGLWTQVDSTVAFDELEATALR